MNEFYLREEIIQSTRYDVYSFLVSSEILSSLRWVRKFYRILYDSKSLPYEYRRRKNSLEYMDTAATLLGRIENAYASNTVTVAGSQFLQKDDKVWSVFGKCDNLPSENYFDSFNDVIDYYANSTLGKKSKIQVYFRCKSSVENYFQLIHKKYSINYNSIASLAILLLKDIIFNCGPDVEDFYDLFTNDKRDDPGSMSIEDWENLRCKMLGRYGEINWRRCPASFYNRCEAINKPKEKFIFKTTLEELDGGLSAGAKTIPMFFKPKLIGFCPDVSLACD